uniref:Uncharacterized protein n=1 Tax=Oryzias latipes TaxID=8090 RepID=A0A3P9LY82_ORYLA
MKGSCHARKGGCRRQCRPLQLDSMPDPLADSMPDPLVDSMPDPLVDFMPDPLVDSMPDPLVDSIFQCELVGWSGGARGGRAGRELSVLLPDGGNCLLVCWFCVSGMGGRGPLQS